MWCIDLSRFKVVYGDRVLNALSLQSALFADSVELVDVREKPKLIEIIVINEDGNIEMLRDEAWRFQFIPILSR